MYRHITPTYSTIIPVSFQAKDFLKISWLFVDKHMANERCSPTVMVLPRSLFMETPVATLEDSHIAT